MEDPSQTQLTPVDISANKDLIQKILNDTDSILALLVKNDEILENLREKASKEQGRLIALETKISSLETTEKTLKDKIIEIEKENTMIKDQNTMDVSGSADAKVALEKCQNKLAKYKSAVESTREKLTSIRERIEKINNSVSVQGSIINDIAGPMRGGSVQTNVNRKYLETIEKLGKSTRPNLNAVAKKMGINPRNYRTKGDLLNAISLIIHAKAGRIHCDKNLKIIAVNLGINCTHRTCKVICAELRQMLNKISIKKL
jgi:DNA repair exonuclease SbcCD ATPase subunit